MKNLQLSPEAYRVLCGLIHPSQDFDAAQVQASDAVWEEIRRVFPLEDHFPLIGTVTDLELEVASRPGTGREDDAFITEVYPAGDPDNPYLEVGSSDWWDAQSTHEELLSSWNQARIGICLNCGSQGWTVDGENYCRGEGHEPEVCAECAEAEPCESHR